MGIPTWYWAFQYMMAPPEVSGCRGSMFGLRGNFSEFFLEGALSPLSLFYSGGSILVVYELTFYTVSNSIYSTIALYVNDVINESHHRLVTTSDHVRSACYTILLNPCPSPSPSPRCALKFLSEVHSFCTVTVFAWRRYLLGAFPELSRGGPPRVVVSFVVPNFPVSMISRRSFVL